MSDDLVKRLRDVNKNYELARGVHVDISQAVKRIEELEAKLAKAVEALGTALDEMVDYADTHPAWSEIWEAREVARTTLAELTGDKDE